MENETLDSLFEDAGSAGQEQETPPHVSGKEKKPCPECGKPLTWLADGSRPRAHKCVPKTEASQVEAAQQLNLPKSGMVCSQCGKLQGTCEHHGQPGYTMVTPDSFSAQVPPAPAPAGIIDRVVEKFIETRDLITKKTKALAAELEDLKELQAKREAFLQGKLDTSGVESMRTAHGICFIDWKDSATVADRDVFLDWVKKEDKFDFLDSRVNKTAVKQALADGDLVPPGVNYTKIKGVKIRRS